MRHRYFPRRLRRAAGHLGRAVSATVSIRSQIIGTVIVSTVLVGGLIAANTVSEFRHARASAAHVIHHEVAFQAQQAEKSYLAPSSTITQLTQGPGVHSLDPAGCHKELETIAKLLSGGGGLAVVHANGTVACSASGIAIGSRPVGTPIWLRDALAHGLGFGGPVTLPGTAKPGIAFAQRFRATSGERVALVILQQSPTAVLWPSSSGVSLLVVNKDTGALVDAWPRPAKTVATTPALTDLVKKLRPGSTATTRGPTGETEIFEASSVLRDSDLLVIGGIERDTAYAAASADLRRNALVGGAIVLVLLAFGWLLLRRISRPIRRLRTAMRRAAESETADRVDVRGPSELATLAHSFNEMVDARERSEARTRSLIRHASDVITVVDARGVVTYASPSAIDLLGLSGESPGTRLIDLVHADDVPRVMRLLQQWIESGHGESTSGEFRLVTPDGTFRDIEARAQNLVDDPAVAGIVVTSRDITERKHAADQLAHAALHDSLTGLPNRALVLDRLDYLLAARGREFGHTAVLFLDLDRFKLINDTSGHAAGDDILVQVAQRLASVTRPGDTLGRLGGDEFVVICDRIASSAGAVALAERLVASLEPACVLDGQDVFLSTSIGIALSQPGDNAGDLLRKADAAMYRAKDAGRGTHAVFDDDMQVALRRRLDIVSALRHALERNELFLDYQPIIALDDRRPTGVEALLRWKTSTGEVVRPDEFIPVAEETGLIVPIGRWVLREACDQLVRWRTRPDFPRDARVSVNVSARQLANPDFVDDVANALDGSGLDSRLLVIEVTESILMRDAVAAGATLSRLRGLGAHISIDDFGTGYSSLGYLQRLPIDELKIDRSFIRSLLHSDRAKSIVASVVSLGHALGLTVTAEGVESPEQAWLLSDAGCDLAQGYHFARPTDPDAVAELLAAPRPEATLPEPRPASDAFTGEGTVL